MKKAAAALFSIFALAGCANDRYTVNQGGPGTGAMLQSDLHDCKHEALNADIHQRYADNGGAIVAAGLVGGAVGGGIIAAASGPHGDVNAAIEACMARKGYTGTSEN